MESKWKQRAKKAQENKNKLILDIVEDLLENHYDSQEYIKCLLIEALSRRTQKELKEINA